MGTEKNWTKRRKTENKVFPPVVGGYQEQFAYVAQSEIDRMVNKCCGIMVVY